MFCLFAPQTIGIFRNPNPEIWLGFIEIHLCFDILKAGFSKELFVLPHHCVNPEMDVKRRRGKWLQDNREMFEKKEYQLLKRLLMEKKINEGLYIKKEEEQITLSCDKKHLAKAWLAAIVSLILSSAVMSLSTWQQILYLTRSLSTKQQIDASSQHFFKGQGNSPHYEVRVVWLF